MLRSSHPTPPPAPEKPPGGVYILSITTSENAAGQTVEIVHFICQDCGAESTRTQRPGFLPRYCETCAKTVKLKKTAARVARHRSNKKAR